MLLLPYKYRKSHKDAQWATYAKNIVQKGPESRMLWLKRAFDIKIAIFFA